MENLYVLPFRVISPFISVTDFTTTDLAILMAAVALAVGESPGDWVSLEMGLRPHQTPLPRPVPTPRLRPLPTSASTSTSASTVLLPALPLLRPLLPLLAVAVAIGCPPSPPPPLRLPSAPLPLPMEQEVLNHHHHHHHNNNVQKSLKRHLPLWSSCASHPISSRALSKTT